MNITAPDGQVWVCAACGKTSHDRYGYQRVSPGWDESCVLNAVLCYDRKSPIVIDPNELYVAVEPQP